MEPQSPESMLSVECGVDSVAYVPSQPGNIVQGELQMMTEMPGDILYEVGIYFSLTYLNVDIHIRQIFTYLPPQDLLSLSRTTRSLRNIVTSRHSGHMWRLSLASVSALPPCPPDLTEIQYASLVFDDHCHVRSFISEFNKR